jgi:hypothetical protein
MMYPSHVAMLDAETTLQCPCGAINTLSRLVSAANVATGHARSAPTTKSMQPTPSFAIGPIGDIQTVVDNKSVRVGLGHVLVEGVGPAIGVFADLKRETPKETPKEKKEKVN